MRNLWNLSHFSWDQHFGPGQPVFNTNWQIRRVTYCTHLPTHLTSKTQFRIPIFSDSVDSATMIQTSTPNAMKCLLYFPNAAILTTSYLKHLIMSKTSIENPLWNQASNNEERIPFTLTFHPSTLAARNVVLRNFTVRSRNSTNFP